MYKINFDNKILDRKKLKSIINWLHNQKIYGNIFIDSNYIINCEGSIDVDIRTPSLPDFIQFGNVIGSFSISDGLLTTLRGVPQKVGLYFRCNNNRLQTLKYAPEVVGYDCNGGYCNFNCSNNQLKSLEYSPKLLSGDFYCYKNNLETLIGIQSEINGNLICSDNQLVDLKTAPKHIKGDFNVSNNLIIDITISNTFIGGQFITKNHNKTNFKTTKKTNIVSFLKKVKDVNGQIIDCDNIYFDGNLNKKITIYCNECNTYTDISPKQLLKGYSCPSHSIKTKEFIKKGVEKYGDNYEYITDRNNPNYWGTTITCLSSENCKIGVKCKKHKNIFETYVDTFLSGKELCPICKFEESKINLPIRNISNYNKKGEIYVHNYCKDSKLINKILLFLKNNTITLHNIFINEDYTVDVEIIDKNDLNKIWRGFIIRIDDNGELPKFINFGVIITSSLNLINFRSFEDIKTLRGMPKIMYGNFNCVGVKLKSLIGAPEQIYGNFNIKNNDIESLVGCPKIIHGDFDISDNKIKSLFEFENADCEIFGKLNRKNNLFVE